MLTDTVILTFSNTSAYQKVVLPDTSAQQRITLFANDQDSSLDMSHLFANTALSLRIPGSRYTGAYLTMLASETILSRDWDQPEEDKAWANL
jgi:hypothetical protein